MARHHLTTNEFKKSPLLSRLLELHTPPKELFIDGELPSISIDERGQSTPRILTVVGSRKNTLYGKRVVEHLLKHFLPGEVIVVSGLALGIDTIAHKAALAHNLTTLAIPGSGLGERVLYPSSNRAVAREILASGGCLISELQDNTGAAPWTFPARNRIMAALSDAVLIIEAEDASGTLITARQALELGKDIGAVPGDIFSPTAAGTHALIRDGATPITSSEDLRELLRLPVHATAKQDTLTLSETETIIMNLLREPQDKDTLLVESGLSLSDFLMDMTTLEMKGYIEETFGEVRKIV